LPGITTNKGHAQGTKTYFFPLLFPKDAIIMPKPLFFASYLGFLAVLKIRRDYGAANSSFQGAALLPSFTHPANIW